MTNLTKYNHPSKIQIIIDIYSQRNRLSHWSSFRTIIWLCSDVLYRTHVKYETASPWCKFQHTEEYELSSLDETTYAGNLQITIRNGVVSVSGIESHETNTVYDMSAHIVYHRAIGSIGHLTPVTYIATVDKKTAKFTLW